jgi:UDP-N-acetyl-D-galactosamine dehydrogenase
VDELYRSIITAGTHLASSIKVAEAAKLIENCQRDINIAFVNELSLIFEKAGIDTLDVLEAAGTKWNFLPFRPGLVGGHCIGVDPYYLTHKAESLGYHPEIILAGRRLNDNMATHVANRVVKLMIKKGHKVQGSSVLMLGITFKENCTDIRNSKNIDVVRELEDYGCNVIVHDPWADVDEVDHEYGLKLSPRPSCGEAANIDAVVLAVSHDQFLNINFQNFSKDNVVIFDIKSILSKDLIDGRL